MLDGVLDERLEQERRHEDVERIRPDVIPDDQTIGKPRPLDLEVLPQEVELGGECDFLLPEAFERQPQQVAQTHQRAIGRLDVAMHQGGNGMQGVEEKMGMELLLERLELRLHQPRLELRGAKATLARLSVIEERIVQRNGRRVPVAAVDYGEDGEAAPGVAEHRRELPRQRRGCEPEQRRDAKDDRPAIRVPRTYLER